MNLNTERIFYDIGHQGMIFLLANMVVMVCAIVILLSILFDFVSYHRPKVSKKKLNSLVDTGSMFLYFFIYCFLLQSPKGRIITEAGIINTLFIITGIIPVIAGCYVNIAGRIALRHNWANQVTIYQDQTLVTGSVYRIVRHPLYASLIWIFSGGSLIYTSYFALLSVVIIFIPMMVYRAKQEEKLLVNELAGYSEYKKRTGMFFPKINIYDKL
jgi:protein-S-isoprenylcysteine O-methyltransferase Ste14